RLPALQPDALRVHFRHDSEVGNDCANRRGTGGEVKKPPTITLNECKEAQMLHCVQHDTR
ncbi:MAG: hypothetical protein SNJ72_08790, partial [Fimbriimonadales bacterium]